MGVRSCKNCGYTLFTPQGLLNRCMKCGFLYYAKDLGIKDIKKQQNAIKEVQLELFHETQPYI